MILMRTLRNDYAKYAREDDDLETLVMLDCPLSIISFLIYGFFSLTSCSGMIIRLTFTYLQERDVNEESGWKLVHGDVFRSPRSLVLLSAVVGTGAQLAVLVLLVILFAIVGMLYVGYVHASDTIQFNDFIKGGLICDVHAIFKDRVIACPCCMYFSTMEVYVV